MTDLKAQLVTMWELANKMIDHAYERGCGHRGTEPKIAAAREQFDATLSAIEAEIDRLTVAVVAERERCARIADDGMLMLPDGGSPTQGECDVANHIATLIRCGYTP